MVIHMYEEIKGIINAMVVQHKITGHSLWRLLPGTKGRSGVEIACLSDVTGTIYCHIYYVDDGDLSSETANTASRVLRDFGINAYFYKCEHV